MSASKSDLPCDDFTAEACGKNYIREKVRPILENRIASYNEIIPKLMELLSRTIKSGVKEPCVFESCRYFKLMKRAFEMLLSKEHTLYEVVGAFIKARECAFALSEELLRHPSGSHEKHKGYYKGLKGDVKLCDEMMSGGISAWF